MKTAIIAFFLFLSFQSFCQGDSYTFQLNKIIGDVQNNFKNLRGEIKYIFKQGDTVFYSREIIENTSQNEISRSHNDTTQFSYYFSCRLDSSSLKQAKKVVDQFKRKTEKALGKTYKLESFYQNNGRMVGESKGFIFKGPNAIITITYGVIGKFPFAFSYLMVHRP